MRWLGLVTLLAGGAGYASAAQIAAPVIQWQRTFGGTNWEYCVGIRQTADGGYIVTGQTDSAASGNKTSVGFGEWDIWLVRLDAAGNKVWDRSYGGSLYEDIAALEVLADGSIVLAGRSDSGTNSCKSAPMLGGLDYWLLKLDANGNRIWDRTYGGMFSERFGCLAVLSDGGFLLGGASQSPPGGNKTSPLLGLGEDYWVVRTDSEGNRLWDHAFGGTGGDEICYSINQTFDGGFVLCGDSPSSSAGGTKMSPPFGGLDAYLVRLDATGTQVWDKCYGGAADERYSKARVLADGGMVLIAMSPSEPGPSKASAGYGSTDFWIARLNPAGDLLWDKSFGGTAGEQPIDVELTSDGGFLICGGSRSDVNGNKTSPQLGSGDGWLVRLDGSGNVLWQLSLGGSNSEIISSVRQTSDGGFILAGRSFAPNLADGDFWVVKLGPDELTAPQLRAAPQSAGAIRESGFRLDLRPPPNAPTNALYVLEASTDRTNWTSIQTNLLNPGASVIELVDPSATNLPARVYRARMER